MVAFRLLSLLSLVSSLVVVASQEVGALSISIEGTDEPLRMDRTTDLTAIVTMPCSEAATLARPPTMDPGVVRIVVETDNALLQIGQPEDLRVPLDDVCLQTWRGVVSFNITGTWQIPFGMQLPLTATATPIAQPDLLLPPPATLVVEATAGVGVGVRFRPHEAAPIDSGQVPIRVVLESRSNVPVDILTTVEGRESYKHGDDGWFGDGTIETAVPRGLLSPPNNLTLPAADGTPSLGTIEMTYQIPSTGTGVDNFRLRGRVTTPVNPTLDLPDALSTLTIKYEADGDDRVGYSVGDGGGGGADVSLPVVVALAAIVIAATARRRLG